jgi:hypothetical protein
MYEVILCDDKRITLKYILPNDDPEPPSTISFRIDNANEGYKVGDHVVLSIKTAHLCNDCKKKQADNFFPQLNIHLCDGCVEIRAEENWVAP